MKRTLVLALCLMLPATLTVAANSTAEKSNVKELSGMSIVGNDEAPKSLYIVPWKSSEIGVESSLKRMNDKEYEPVDRDIFIRQLNFYETSTTHQTGRN